MVVVAVVVVHGGETLGEFLWHTRAFLIVQVQQKGARGSALSLMIGSLRMLSDNDITVSLVARMLSGCEAGQCAHADEWGRQQWSKELPICVASPQLLMNLAGLSAGGYGCP